MPEAGRARARRAARLALWGMAAAYVVEAVELRRRAGRLVALGASGASGAADGGSGGGASGGGAGLDGAGVGGAGAPQPAGRLVTLAGVEIDARTRAAAADEAVAAGIQAIDLVPADIPVERALRVLRRVDPARLRVDPLYAPGGAHEAVVLDGSLDRRLGVASTVAPDRAGLARLTVRAQRHAPAATAMRVAPGLRAAPQTAADRWRELDELTAFARPLYALAPVLVAARAIHLAVLAAGVLLAPAPGLVALASWSAQPAVALAGPRGPGGLAPPGVRQAVLARWPRAGAELVRTARAGWRDARRGRRGRATRVATVPPPEEARFEARRATCPWCGSRRLAGRLDTIDLFQHKPGAFHLDECVECGHIFQNPRLSPAGLDYYYEQFYDGVSEDLTEVSFSAMARIYHRRADVLARFTQPRACLDVGTGHGHFCLVARRRWPGATFDGLDLSDAVEEARRRGWIDTAYRGAFPDLADGLPRSYDVVTMHHYLEHTREPRRELQAAAKVLEPGGYLVVEVPDPASPWSRRLGRFWYSWFQPQHQHFVTCENLVAELEGEGFDVVSVERGPANLGGDLFTAVVLAMQRVAPPSQAPWLPAPGLARRAWRLAVIALATPALVAAAVPDLIMDVRLRRPGTDAPGNALRVVARRS